MKTISMLALALTLNGLAAFQPFPIIPQAVAAEPELPPPPPLIPPDDSRRAYDDRFARWCAVEKAIPEAEGTCFCVVNQFHIQGIGDGTMAQIIDSIARREDASDPHFRNLSDPERDKFSRAAELCGATFRM